jgi:hypothetical protein
LEIRLAQVERVSVAVTVLPCVFVSPGAETVSRTVTMLAGFVRVTVIVEPAIVVVLPAEVTVLPGSVVAIVIVDPGTVRIIVDAGIVSVEPGSVIVEVIVDPPTVLVEIDVSVVVDTVVDTLVMVLPLTVSVIVDVSVTVAPPMEAVTVKMSVTVDPPNVVVSVEVSVTVDPLTVVVTVDPDSVTVAPPTVVVKMSVTVDPPKVVVSVEVSVTVDPPTVVVTVDPDSVTVVPPTVVVKMSVIVEPPLVTVTVEVPALPEMSTVTVLVERSVTVEAGPLTESVIVCVIVSVTVDAARVIVSVVSSVIVSVTGSSPSPIEILTVTQAVTIAQRSIPTPRSTSRSLGTAATVGTSVGISSPPPPCVADRLKAEAAQSDNQGIEALIVYLFAGINPQLGGSEEGKQSPELEKRKTAPPVRPVHAFLGCTSSCEALSKTSKLHSRAPWQLGPPGPRDACLVINTRSNRAINLGPSTPRCSICAVTTSLVNVGSVVNGQGRVESAARGMNCPNPSSRSAVCAAEPSLRGKDRRRSSEDILSLAGLTATKPREAR